MKIQKKKFAEFFNVEFYVKLSLTVLIITIMVVLFFTLNGRMFFEFYPYTQAFEGNSFQIHTIDVGNGDAIIIKFPNNQTMMIDTGDDFYEKKVTSYVQQYLWSERLDKIDYLVLTHPDSDHVGGAKAVIERFDVNNLFRPKILSKTEEERYGNSKGFNVSETYVYDQAIMTAYNRNCNMIYAEKGIAFNMGEAKVEFLSPEFSSYNDSNNYSAVIMISYQSRKFLFMGDAEKSIENRLIEVYGDYLKADVLKVGHHGSSTSSSLEFLKVVDPDFSILSCASTQTFPNQKVVEALKEVNCKSLNTGIRGSFALSIEDNQIVYANADKPVNYLAIILIALLLLIFMVWANPIKKIKEIIINIKND